MTDQDNYTKERFDFFVNHSSECYWEMDYELRYSLVSSGFEGFLGEDNSDLIGKTHAGALGEQANHDSQQKFIRLINQHKPVSKMLLCRVYPDQRELWAEISCNPHLDSSGKFVGYLGVARDVTVQIESINGLMESEKFTHDIIDSVPAMIANIDADERFRFVNAPYSHLFGLDPVDMIGKHIKGFFDRELYERTAVKRSDVMSGNAQHFEETVLDKDENRLHVEISFIPQFAMEGTVTGFFSMIQDISDRKHSENELEIARADLVEAQRIAQVGSWELNLVSGLLTWSDEIFRIFEIDQDKFGASYDAFVDAIHPDDRDMVNTAYTESLENQESYIITHRLQMPDGRIKWVEERCESNFDDAGNPLRSWGTVQDVTDLKKAEGKTAWLVDAIDAYSGTIVIYDHEDRIVFGNKIFRDSNQKIADYTVPGVKYEDFIRASVAKGLLLDAIGREEEWISERLKQHQECGDSFEMVRSEGHLLINEQRLADGGIATIAIDIGRQKEAENKAKAYQERLEEIIEIAPEAVITIGSDMAIQLFNHGAERIFGYSSEEVLGQPMEILIPASLRQGHDRHIQRFGDSPDTYRLMDQREIIAGLRKDGTEFPASASVSKLEAGGEQIFTVMLQDISERQRVEQERHNALVEAEQANQAKSKFLATMSHEFRTPLNAILGFSEMLRSEYFGPLGAEKYCEYADNIHKSGEHMLALVNDVLDISAIEAGKRDISKEVMVADEFLNDCIRNIKNIADRAGVSLSLEIADNMPTLYADRRSATQIVFNLLSNAVKFTNEGGKIRLFAKVEKENFLITVKDTGIGIPADKLTAVTEPFSQADSNPHNAQEGTGLGLAIVKSLVEAHDGELFIESEIGKGTTVTVTFPLSETISDTKLR